MMSTRELSGEPGQAPLYDKQEHQAAVFAAHFLFGSEMAVATLESEATTLLGVHRVRIVRAA